MSVTKDPQKDMEAALARVMAHIPADFVPKTPDQMHQDYMQETIEKKAAIAAVNRAALSGDVRVIRGPSGESLVQDSAGNTADLSDIGRRGYLRMLQDRLRESKANEQQVQNHETQPEQQVEHEYIDWLDDEL
jgi:hypothetical protein